MKKGSRGDLTAQPLLKQVYESFYVDTVALPFIFELFRYTKDKKQIYFFSELFSIYHNQSLPFAWETLLSLLCETDQYESISHLIERYEGNDESLMSLCKKIIPSAKGPLSPIRFFTVSMLLQKSRKSYPQILILLWNNLHKDSNAVFLKVLEVHFEEIVKFFPADDGEKSIKRSKKIFEYFYARLEEYSSNGDELNFSKAHSLFCRFSKLINSIYKPLKIGRVICSSESDVKVETIVPLYEQNVLIFQLRTLLLIKILSDDDIILLLENIDRLSVPSLEEEWTLTLLSKLLLSKSISDDVYNHLNNYLLNFFNSSTRCLLNYNFLTVFFDWVASVIKNPGFSQLSKRYILNITLAFLGHFWKLQEIDLQDQKFTDTLREKSKLLIELLVTIFEVFDFIGPSNVNEALELRDKHLTWLTHGGKEKLTKEGVAIAMKIFAYPKNAYAQLEKKPRVLDVQECMDAVIHDRYYEIAECCSYSLAYGLTNTNVLLEYILCLHIANLPSTNKNVKLNNPAIITSLAYFFSFEVRNDLPVLACVNKFFNAIQIEAYTSITIQENENSHPPVCLKDYETISENLHSIIIAQPDYCNRYPYLIRILMFCYTRLKSGEHTTSKLLQLQSLASIKDNHAYRIILLEHILYSQLKSGNFDSSFKTIDLLAEAKSPRLHLYHKTHADILYLTGKIEESIILYRQVVDFNPSLENCIALASVCIEYNKQPEMLDLLTTLLESKKKLLKGFSSFLISVDRILFIQETLFKLLQLLIDKGKIKDPLSLRGCCRLITHFINSHHLYDHLALINISHTDVLINYTMERIEEFQIKRYDEFLESAYEFLILLLISKKETQEIRKYCYHLGKKYPTNKKLISFMKALIHLEKSLIKDDSATFNGVK